MNELILHHYWESPYAEKIRRVMGMKNLAWRSVIIPMMMPKPDLTALTGGYRKTPVLQIGAYIYCDSDLIAREIDRRHPDPPLFPAESVALAMMLSSWQQEFFFLAVRTAGMSAPIFPPGFLKDRATMVDVPLTMEQAISDAPALLQQLRAKLDLLDRHLSTRRFVLGDVAGLADLSLFHPANTLRVVPQTTPLLEPFASVRSWMERIDAFGYGAITEMSPADAVEVARAATPERGGSVDPDEIIGLTAGDGVEVVHESFGRDPVAGELVSSTVQEIAIARRDDRAGDVVVHFPREHYKVKKL